MPYTIQIVCLANSRKLSGRCIAGKVTAGQHIGSWIRPIGTTQSHEITERDREYQNGETAQKLDVIDITFTAPQAPNFQRENHVIDDTVYWEKVGRVDVADLAGLVDTPSALWENGYHSTSGRNDRVPESSLTAPRQTLFLIRPQSVRITVDAEGAAFGDPKRSVRARFTYNGQPYSLKITDPAVEQFYKAQPNGEYFANDMAYFTISLGETFNGYAYKLVAAVFCE
ncbi:MAG: hypothetical protein H2073_13755 [Pseudomonas sp.]|jgi:hypothetical protein|uniref:dual OB domain-containing protein n=1 Tax=Stutzerimonas frequens TaxID=2968969 RepID=UPI000C633D3F|nr:hypothetical protein [Stutzerimonas frequens]MAL92973.1 hypothetical protein [Pseudomonas sp.]MEC7472090.1 hypothetical protein [Pseudomonadota bacterium]MBA4727056.1 hypothetical protein [Pseudomonas sp.]MBK3916366.1 hypothetical protein [Stutzerimonas frequens]QFU13145.1 hypothetical protein FIU84_14240 [Stutzerimonas frequens]|tara:strand:+ start:4370 stop:5050 length:681 start_codon:yes stop_codon:yes gene_type:complete